MLRDIFVGLCVLCSVGCGSGDQTDDAVSEVVSETGTRELPPEMDGGVPPDPACNWFVYWLTQIDREAQCNWGMKSHDPTVALFRTNGGECLAPATICGIPACSDVSFVRERQIIEVWGPAGLDDDTVWSVTESFACE